MLNNILSSVGASCCGVFHEAIALPQGSSNICCIDLASSSMFAASLCLEMKTLDTWQFPW